jgi:hypothetical protein
MLILLAVAQLGFRGRQRMQNDLPLWDFLSVYSATRTWIQGGDPYDLPRVVETWRATGVYTDRDVSYWATVYPPNSLVMMAPLAMMPPVMAMLVWLAIMLVLIGLQFAALAQLVGTEKLGGKWLILVGAALFSAPFQFGILSGQLSMPAISLVAITFWCVARQRHLLGGILLGIACAIKPQVAGPFVIYYLITRRWKLSIAAMITGGAVLAIALVAMQLTHIPWLAGWTRSIQDTGRIGDVNDYGWANRFRDEIIDLKIILVSFISNPTLLRGAIGAITLGFLAWLVAVFPRGRAWSVSRETLALAGLSAIILLPIYHRVYDGALLATALAWALAELRGRWRGYSVAMLIAMLPFLVPFDIVKSVGTRKPAVAQMAESWWWESFFAPHYALGLLATTIVIHLWMTPLRREAPQPAELHVADAAASS